MNNAKEKNLFNIYTKIRMNFRDSLAIKITAEKWLRYRVRITFRDVLKSKLPYKALIMYCYFILDDHQLLAS